MLVVAVLPVVFIAGFLVLIALRKRSGGWSALRGGPLLLLLALGASYALGFAAINADPTYDDNGWPEFVELRYRWVWAAVFGLLFALVIVPSAFAFRALWRWWRSRRCYDRDDAAR